MLYLGKINQHYQNSAYCYVLSNAFNGETWKCCGRQRMQFATVHWMVLVQLPSVLDKAK